MKKILLLAVVAVMFIATPVMAREGWFVGAGLAFDNIVGSDLNNYEAGGGLNFKLGYKFDAIAVEGDWFQTSHTGKTGYTDADLSGLNINLRVSFSQPDDPSQVYLLAGLGAYLLEFKQPTFSGITELHGSGVNLGVGVEHYFNPQVALNLGLIYRIINYDEAEDAFGTFSISDMNGDTVSLNAGLNLYF
jgi:Outer membrane protein beta-barrel domain